MSDNTTNPKNNPLLPIIEKMYGKSEDKMRLITSENYNSFFNYEDGLFIRCGKKLKDDPDFSPFGPEILDLEVSEVCSKGCEFCYKSNQTIGANMSFETFKEIFHKMPINLTQIAFGIGDIDGNPDLFKMLYYCVENDYNQVIPNITINGSRMSMTHYDLLSFVCGAIAVSNYGEESLDAVKQLTDRGHKQINLHQLVSVETFEECKDIILKSKIDSRLEELNAIVFLSLKRKGRGEKMTVLPQRQYKELIDLAFDVKARIGFDSCSAPKFLESVSDSKDFQQFHTMAEPCESTLFSSYINVLGKFYPCSFAEGSYDMKGIDVAKSEDFLKDVWFHPDTVKFRDTLIATAKCNKHNCRECPIFEV